MPVPQIYQEIEIQMIDNLPSRWTGVPDSFERWCILQEVDLQRHHSRLVNAGRLEQMAGANLRPRRMRTFEESIVAFEVLTSPNQSGNSKQSAPGSNHLAPHNAHSARQHASLQPHVLHSRQHLERIVRNMGRSASAYEQAMAHGRALTSSSNSETVLTAPVLLIIEMKGSSKLCTGAVS